MTFSHIPDQNYDLTKHFRVQAAAPPTIHSFQRLHEFQLKMTVPESHHRAVLSSIASTELRKIILSMVHWGEPETFPRKTEEWALTDKLLCELVDRLCAVGYCHTLEVELQPRRKVWNEPGEYGDFTEVLPRFREKGVVTVTGIESYSDAFPGGRVDEHMDIYWPCA